MKVCPRNDAVPQGERKPCCVWCPHHRLTYFRMTTGDKFDRQEGNCSAILQEEYVNILRLVTKQKSVLSREMTSQTASSPDLLQPRPPPSIDESHHRTHLTTLRSHLPARTAAAPSHTPFPSPILPRARDLGPCIRIQRQRRPAPDRAAHWPVLLLPGAESARHGQQGGTDHARLARGGAVLRLGRVEHVHVRDALAAAAGLEPWRGRAGQLSELRRQRRDRGHGRRGGR